MTDSNSGMDDRGLQALRGALEGERTRGEELTRSLRQLQRDSEAEVAAVSALLQSEKQRSIALQAALQRQGQALLTAFEARTIEALHTEHVLRDEIQTLHRAQRKMEKLTPTRFNELEANLALERRKNRALEDRLAALKQFALNQLKDKEHTICRLGKEMEELKGKLEAAERKVAQGETIVEMLKANRQLLAYGSKRSKSELIAMSEDSEDDYCSFLGTDKENIPQSKQLTISRTDSGLLSKPVCFADVSNCSFLSDQTNPQATEERRLTHSMGAAEPYKGDSCPEVQLPRHQSSSSALSDPMEGSCSNIVVGASEADTTIEALRLELCAKELDASALEAEKQRLEREAAELSRRYFALVTAYDAVKGEKEVIDSEFRSLLESHRRYEEATALSSSAAMAEATIERELLACEKDAARTELAAAQDAWASEKQTLQQALEEMEKQVVHTNVKYAEAATELEVQRRLLRDGGKQSKRRSILFSFLRT